MILQILSQKRRAISTIIGTFFFIVIMVGAFAAFILMMQTNSEFLNTQLGVSQNEIEKIQGQYTITAAYDHATGNRLCVSVKNSGSTPLEIADLFIVNKTNNSVRLFDIDFRDAFVPVSSIRDILDNQPITLTAGTSGTTYDLKVVSASGIVQTTELKVFPISSPDPRFNVTAFAYPVNAASGQNVTLGAHVFNRMNTTLLNVQPDGDPTVDPDEAVSEGFNLVTRANIARLDPNESTMFMWEPEFVGGIGSKLNFTVNIKAQVEGCTGSSFITNSDSTLVKVVPGVRRQILASPELLVSVPTPFGGADTTDFGLFAVVVLNPTDKSMKVNQVSLQIANPAIVDLVADTYGTTTPATGWNSVHSKSSAFWTGTGASAITIPPYDIREFIVRIGPRGTPSENYPINPVTFNVYSTFGQFSSDLFSLGTFNSDQALVNVYGNTAKTGAGTPKYAISDIASGSKTRFNFTIQNVGNANVAAGAYILINIPPGMDYLANAQADTGLTADPVVEFADGSVQVPVQLTSALVAGGAGARTYSFLVEAPVISVPAHYTFVITANGTSAGTGTPPIGPLSSVVVQICPTEGTLCQ